MPPAPSRGFQIGAGTAGETAPSRPGIITAVAVLFFLRAASDLFTAPNLVEPWNGLFMVLAAVQVWVGVQILQLKRTGKAVGGLIVFIGMIVTVQVANEMVSTPQVFVPLIVSAFMLWVLAVDKYDRYFT